MIEAAGHGVAMGNAVDQLKEKAEFITTPILEDGVWNGLSHYNLI
jgi:hydroxymethylpyrimidine pyrophosphatase-like HAD family hydrolase